MKEGKVHILCQGIMESPGALAMAVFSELKIISKLVLRTKDLLPIVSIGSTEVD